METIHTAAISRHPSVRTSVTHETLANTDNVYSVATMNCDWIARFYRRLEYLSFGGALQACRVMYVRDVADCQRAIVCGDGDGRFLAELIAGESLRFALISSISAKGWRTLARRRVAAIGLEAVVRANFHVADVREFNPSDGAAYDLITAHFFLDCFDDAEVTSVTRRLASYTRPGATLLLSDFRIPPSGIAHYAAAAIIRGLYFAFRVATGLRVTRLPNYEDALERAGFRKQRETLKLGGLLVASLWRRI